MNINIAKYLNVSMYVNSDPRNMHWHKPCSIQDRLQRLQQSHIGRVSDVEVASHQSGKCHTADAGPPLDHVKLEGVQRHLAARTLVATRIFDMKLESPDDSSQTQAATFFTANAWLRRSSSKNHWAGMITSESSLASELVVFQYLSPLSHGELCVCLPPQG